MQLSLIDAFQTGHGHFITIVIFAFYHWHFQALCRQMLDELNRLIYLLFMAILLLFILVGHWTSENFEFIDLRLGAGAFETLVLCHRLVCVCCDFWSSGCLPCSQVQAGASRSPERVKSR